MSYVALDKDIWTSTVLKEGPIVVATWLLLMADADRYGITRATPASIASVLRIPDEEVEQAFEALKKKDPKSRNKEYGGARIVDREDGSYLLVSFSKYKERASRAAATKRQREYEERKRMSGYRGPHSEETAVSFKD